MNLFTFMVTAYVTENALTLSVTVTANTAIGKWAAYLSVSIHNQGRFQDFAEGGTYIWFTPLAGLVQNVHTCDRIYIYIYIYEYTYICNNSGILSLHMLLNIDKCNLTRYVII